MKLEINDARGTHLIKVLKLLDGSPAIAGEDYVEWTGEFHKNGKWSYAEGGVALLEGIVIVHKKSTHARLNNITHLIVVENNEIKTTKSIGKFSELSERPKKDSTKISDQVWNNIIDTILNSYQPEIQRKILSKWESIEKFL